VGRRVSDPVAGRAVAGRPCPYTRALLTRPPLLRSSAGRARGGSAGAGGPCNVCFGFGGQLRCLKCQALVHHSCLSVRADTRVVGTKPAAKLRLARQDFPSGVFRCDECEFTDVFGRLPGVKDDYLIELVRRQRIDAARHLEPGTRSTYWGYIGGKDGFLTFERDMLQHACRIVPRRPDDAWNETAFCLWLEHYAESGGRDGTGRAASTIRRASAAVASFTDPLGVVNPFDESQRVRDTLDGILKRIGTEPKQQVALMIDVLRHIEARIVGPVDEISALDYPRSRELAEHYGHFFAAFRGGEATALKREHVTLVYEGDVVNGRRVRSGEAHVSFRLEGSKTDKHVNVLNIIVAAETATGFKPFAVFERFLALRDERGLAADAPLFVQDNDVTPITLTYYRNNLLRRRLAELKKDGLVELAAYNVKDFGSHSMRRGFVVSARDAEVPIDIIENHGRWAWRTKRMVLWYGGFSLKMLLSATRAL